MAKGGGGAETARDIKGCCAADERGIPWRGGSQDPRRGLARQEEPLEHPKRGFQCMWGINGRKFCLGAEIPRKEIFIIEGQSFFNEIHFEKY